MATYKTRTTAKIGTHGSTTIVLWDSKPFQIGDKIYVMELRLYDSLHSSIKRLKSCKYWERLLVTDVNPILFLSR